jgi:hypothetical protein
MILGALGVTVRELKKNFLTTYFGTVFSYQNEYTASALQEDALHNPRTGDWVCFFSRAFVVHTVPADLRL